MVIIRLAYFETNSTDFWQYANHWFNGSDWRLAHFQAEPVNFFDYYSPSRNLSVVVRPPRIFIFILFFIFKRYIYIYIVIVV